MSAEPLQTATGGPGRDWLHLGGPSSRPEPAAGAGEVTAAPSRLSRHEQGFRAWVPGVAARLRPLAARLGRQAAAGSARVGQLAGAAVARLGAAAGDLVRSSWRARPAVGLAGVSAGRGARVREWLRGRRRLGPVGWTSLALAGLLLGGLAYVAYCVMTIPDGGGIAAEPTPPAVFVRAGDGQLFATRGVIKGEKLSATALPPNLKAAVIAIEDRRFYSHHGIDLRGIMRAAWRNAGGAREGASTITQQLARLVYLSQERSIRRKIQEAALAIWLDYTLEKDEILARYLNAAYFGAGAWGADAAARRYFGKPAEDLDLAEAAVLAGLVRSPSTLAPNKNLDGARARAELVLNAMLETGAATPEEIEAARKNPASIWTPPEAPPGTGYFVDMVEAEARRISKDGAVDVVAETTLDLRLQAAAERIVMRFLEEEGAAKNVSQAAVVALAPDGAILAMVGGRNYVESQFNRAAQAKRQPGSLFKLFVYLAAFQRGATPNSMAVDRPIRIGNWEPENYGGRHRGAVSLRAAFAASINTVAVQVAEAVGMEHVIATARDLGVASDLPRLPSLSLGSAEVTLLEMTRAYAAVAAGVERVEPYALKSLAKGGQPATEPSPRRLQAAKDAEAREAMLQLLLSVVQEGTGRAARLPGAPVGGKTGTTQENRDAWFVGFTPGVTIGVWVGNDDNTPTKGVTGGDLPARIWKAVATEALRALPRREPEQAAADRTSSVEQAAAPAPPSQAALRGRARVRDTGTLEIAGQEVKLAGVEGVGGTAARDLARYIRGREVACVPEADDPKSYRCVVAGQDLARVVLYNGGGRARPDASYDQLEAEQHARAARVGVWER